MQSSFGKILGIDPGGTTGFGLVHAPGVIQEIGEVEKEEFLSWVNSWTDDLFDAVACEDFIARPKLTDGRWTELPVAKQIGAIQLRCFQLGKPCIMQQPSIKPVGYKLAKIKYTPGKRGLHIYDGVAHAFHLLRLGYRASQKV